MAKRPEERPKPSRTVHVSLSVRGALTWKDSQLRGMFRISQGGGCLDAKEARELLMDCLANGQEFLPMGPCEGFDPKTGSSLDFLTIYPPGRIYTLKPLAE
jgi:hypothetical protein